MADSRRIINFNFPSQTSHFLNKFVPFLSEFIALLQEIYIKIEFAIDLLKTKDTNTKYMNSNKRNNLFNYVFLRIEMNRNIYVQEDKKTRHQTANDHLLNLLREVGSFKISIYYHFVIKIYFFCQEYPNHRNFH